MGTVLNSNQVPPSGGGGGLSWSVITADQNIDVNNGYICNQTSSILALNLPSSSAVGDLFEVVGMGAAGWGINQNSGQKIIIGEIETTVGASGAILSTHERDCIRAVCIVANTTWQVISSMGNILVI